VTAKKKNVDGGRQIPEKRKMGCSTGGRKGWGEGGWGVGCGWGVGEKGERGRERAAREKGGAGGDVLGQN